MSSLTPAASNVPFWRIRWSECSMLISFGCAHSGNGCAWQHNDKLPPAAQHTGAMVIEQEANWLQSSSVFDEKKKKKCRMPFSTFTYVSGDSLNAFARKRIKFIKNEPVHQLNKVLTACWSKVSFWPRNNIFWCRAFGRCRIRPTKMKVTGRKYLKNPHFLSNNNRTTSALNGEKGWNKVFA